MVSYKLNFGNKTPFGVTQLTHLTGSNLSRFQGGARRAILQDY